MVLYLVSKGADVMAFYRRGQTTADMANGPTQRIEAVGIELWQEARRLGDLRRRKASQIPGAIDWPNYEAISTLSTTIRRASVFPFRTSNAAGIRISEPF